MAHIIIHHNGVYNIWSTICDEPLFVSGLSKENLEYYIKEEHGNRGLEDLPCRLERSHEKGSSSQIGETLEDHIGIYIRLHKGGDYDRDNFIHEFLTIKENT